MEPSRWAAKCLRVVTASGAPLEVADFNGDGNLDLAVACEGTGIIILLGNGNGGFTSANGTPLFENIIVI